MADKGIRVLDLVVKANTALTDQVVTVWNAGTATAQTVLLPVSALNYAPVIADPANSTALVVSQGQFYISNNYVYFATAANHLKRVALADF